MMRWYEIFAIGFSYVFGLCWMLGNTFFYSSISFFVFIFVHSFFAASMVHIILCILWISILIGIWFGCQSVISFCSVLSNGIFYYTDWTLNMKQQAKKLQKKKMKFKIAKMQSLKIQIRDTHHSVSDIGW